MPSIAFAAPIPTGQTEQLRQGAVSHVSGDRKEAYEASRRRHGITRKMSWIQPTPMGDLSVVYIEADDLEPRSPGSAPRRTRSTSGSGSDPRDPRDQHRGRLPATRASDGLPRRRDGVIAQLSIIWTVASATPPFRSPAFGSLSPTMPCGSARRSRRAAR